ncbi:MAG TPA: hypothetical protein DCM05_18350 [Elusimicrobia bacterium]|nr:hypothetical protein [Elusimicrobiota bacterium]
MIATADLIEDFLLDPPRAAEDVRRKPPLMRGLAAFLLGGLSVGLVSALFSSSRGLAWVWPSLALSCLLHILGGAIMTAIFHFVAEASGGEGRASSLFVLLGFSDLAWALVLPAAMLANALRPDSYWPLPLLIIFGGLLTFTLRVRSVRSNYGLSAARATMVVVLPYAAAAVLSALVVFLFAWSMVAQVVKLFS